MDPTAQARGPDAVARLLARHRLTPGRTAPWVERPLPAPTWDALVQRVIEERLTGLLLAAIDDGCLPVDAVQERRARNLYLQEVRLGLRLEAALVEVLDRLDRMGVDHRVLKGPAMAHLVYRHPEHRPFRDIDLLVPGAHIGQVIASLERDGGERRFRRPHPGFDEHFAKGMNVRLANGLDIDLHRTLALGPYGLALDPDELFRTSTPFDLAGRGALALGAEEMLLHAGYHAALGDWPPRLLPHRDVAELLLAGQAHEERVMALARRWRSEAPLALAITTAARCFDLDGTIPLVAWAERQVLSRGDRRTMDLYRGGDSAALAAAGVFFVPGARERCRYARMLLMPDRSYLDEREGTYVERWRHAARLVRGLAMGFARRGSLR